MNRKPRTLLLLLLLVSAALPCAKPVEIVSPDTAQTYSYASAERKKLWWLEKEGVFCAQITFSTIHYADRNEPARRETFLFRFPEVKFDPATKTCSVPAGEGKPLPIAVREKGLFGIGSWIRLLPGTVIYISKYHGDVKLILTASERKQFGMWDHNWIEDNEGWFLQNLLRDVSGSP
jgi:hypothetical protein